MLLVAVWFYIPLVEGIWARYRRGWDSRVESGVDFYEENALRGKVSNYKFVIFVLYSERTQILEEQICKQMISSMQPNKK